nr:cilia- and flagella-associated protein 251-like [Procambarus clarkii]
MSCPQNCPNGRFWHKKNLRIIGDVLPDVLSHNLTEMLIRGLMISRVSIEEAQKEKEKQKEDKNEEEDEKEKGGEEEEANEKKEKEEKKEEDKNDDTAKALASLSTAAQLSRRQRRSCNLFNVLNDGRGKCQVTFREVKFRSTEKEKEKHKEDKNEEEDEKEQGDEEEKENENKEKEKKEEDENDDTAKVERHDRQSYKRGKR